MQGDPEAHKGVRIAWRDRDRKRDLGVRRIGAVEADAAKRERQFAHGGRRVDAALEHSLGFGVPALGAQQTPSS